MNAAAVYVRISSDPSGERAGVSRQLDECRALAARRGWHLAEVYEDDDRSAYSGKPRPAYERMLADVRAGHVGAVIAWHPDRLYRRVRDLLDLISLAEQHRIEIATCTAGDVDLSTPTGRAVATTICAWAGEFESAHKAERVSVAARRRAEQGRIHRTRSFGYDRDLAPIPAEAEAVRRAVRMIIAGSSLRSVGADLDAQGLTTPHGHPWPENLGTLRSVLISHKIAGIASYKGEPLDVEPQWEPLISRAEHEQVCAVLLDARRRTNGHVQRARKALLSGIAVCGVCAGPMRSATKEISRRNHGRVPVYRCYDRQHTTLRQENLDDLVREAVVSELLCADLTALAPSEADGQRMTELRDELEGIAKRRSEVAGLVADGSLTGTEAREALSGLAEAQRAAAGSLQAISARFGPAEFAVRSQSLLTLPDHEADAEGLTVGRRFDALDLGRQRSIIAALLEVTVNRNEHPLDRVVIVSKASGENVTPRQPSTGRFTEKSPR